MRPQSEPTPSEHPDDQLQDARRAAWIEDLPLSDPIFDVLFGRRDPALPGEPPAPSSE